LFRNLPAFTVSQDEKGNFLSKVENRCGFHCSVRNRKPLTMNGKAGTMAEI
jgi:hypothetical protein